MSAPNNNRAAANGEPKFDVYAKPYIPRALIKINAVPATVVNSLAAPTIDYTRYIRSFVGEDFLSVLAQPPTFFNGRPVTPSKDLEPSTYSEYFQHGLWREEKALQAELDEYALYGVDMRPARDPSNCVYSVSVPGLRESGLRVETGDLVYVRQLVLKRNGDILFETAVKDPAGLPIPLPPTVYTQHNATVWHIDRRHEKLHLRIDKLRHGTMKFNIRFVIQHHSALAIKQAVARTSEQLQIRNDWVRSMLFPGTADGQMQKALNATPGSLGDRGLNYEQARGVHTVASQNYGRVPFLISGPPGTGKTRTVVAMAMRLLQQDSKARLLLCAPSDPACDTLVERLGQHLKPQSLLRLNSPTRSFAEVPNTVLPFCQIDENIFGLPLFADLMQKKIVVVTCRDAEILLKAALSNRDLFAIQQKTLSVFSLDEVEPSPQSPLHWSGLIIDEAAQANEPEALGPLMVVAPPKDYGQKMPLVVMVGDQHQLGPRTVSKDPIIQTSLFERLLARPLYREHPLARTKQSNGVMRPLTKDMLPIVRPPFADLIRNYRSDPAILATPSSLFYNDTLEPAISRKSSLLSWSAFQQSNIPVLFSDNRSADEIERDGGGWYNLGEADLALQYATSLLSEGSVQQQDEICIMSPFRAQVNKIRAKARERLLYDVNIGPLEAFQGLEKRFVIVCTTRTRDRFIDQDIARGLGVIHESRRFNVALTRAKEGLVVIGSPAVLVGDENWAAFIAFCKRMGAWAGDREQDWAMPHSSKIKPSRLEKQMKWRSKVTTESADINGTTRQLASLKFGMSEDEAFYESGVAAEQAVDQEDFEDLEE